MIFTPSTTSSPTPLSGVSDSTHLLKALGQTGKKEDKDGSLVRTIFFLATVKQEISAFFAPTLSQTELTPRSLPDLLASSAGISSTLVLWCNGDASSDMAMAFKDQADHTPNLVFAWINRFELRLEHDDQHIMILSVWQ